MVGNVTGDVTGDVVGGAISLGSSATISDPSVSNSIVTRSGSTGQVEYTNTNSVSFNETSGVFTLPKLSISYMGTSQSNSTLPILIRNPSGGIVSADIISGVTQFGYNPSTDSMTISALGKSGYAFQLPSSTGSNGQALSILDATASPATTEWQSIPSVASFVDVTSDQVVAGKKSFSESPVFNNLTGSTSNNEFTILCQNQGNFTMKKFTTLLDFNPSSNTLSSPNMTCSGTIVENGVSLVQTYAPISGSTIYAPATGSTIYAPISGSGNYAPATGSTIYAPISTTVTTNTAQIMTASKNVEANFSCKNLFVGGKYNSDQPYLPVNYTEIFYAGNIPAYYSSEDDSGANVGKWGFALLGSPIFFKWKSNESGVVRKNYYPHGWQPPYSSSINYMIWTWDTVVLSTSPPSMDASHLSKYFYLYDDRYNGSSWEMSFTARFKNKCSTNRVAPRMILRRKRGSAYTYYDESEFIHYVRHSLAPYSSVKCQCILHDVQDTDEYQLILTAARAGSATFTSTLLATEWQVENLVHSMRYIGNYDMNSPHNPRDPNNYG